MTKRSLLIAVLLLFGISHQAWAQKSPFLQAFEDGETAFNLFKYDEARALFEKARDLDPKSPGPYRWLAKIAKVQERWPDCVRDAVTSLKLKPDQKKAPEVRKDLDECRAKLGRPAYSGDIPKDQGALAVITNVEGASVTVDDIKKGATPMSPFPLNPGKRKVRIERRGYLPVDAEIEVVVTIVVDLEVELKADPNASMDDRMNPQPTDDIKIGWILIASNVGQSGTIMIDGKPPKPEPDGSYVQEPGVHTLEITAPGYEPYRRRIKVARGQKRTVKATLKSTAERKSQRRTAFIAFGVAAAAGASGLAFGIMEGNAYEEALDIWQTETTRPSNPDTVMLEPMRTRADYDDAKSRADTYGLISNISIGVAAVALGVSIYYFVQERSAERPGFDLPMAFVPAVTPDGKGAQVVYTRELGW